MLPMCCRRSGSRHNGCGRETLDAHHKPNPCPDDSGAARTGPAGTDDSAGAGYSTADTGYTAAGAGAGHSAAVTTWGDSVSKLLILSGVTFSSQFPSGFAALQHLP